MTDLAIAGALLYGERWQAAMDRELGVSRRTVVNWSNGIGAPSEGHWRAIVALLRTRAKAASKMAGRLGAKMEDAAHKASRPQTPMAEMVKKIAARLRQIQAGYDAHGYFVRDMATGADIIAGVSHEEADEAWHGAAARAAIEAMKMPTEAMMEAADEPFHDELKKQRAYAIERYGKPAYATGGFTERMWRAMLAAALAEGEEG